ncbi:MAG: serine/threonine-protein kinase [Dokdonella sp.]
MAANDKKDFLVPGGGLRSNLLSRAVGEIDSAQDTADRLRHDREDADLVGTWIGPYHLLSLLGSGGMGSVYLADQTDDSISRRVALKVLREAGFSRDARARFARERRILASLAHPNIAALYDSGETEAGVQYYTMEHVEGSRINEYCREQVPTVAGRVALLRDVASALACAHRSLIIHRDIKPSNVLVSGDGHVKLLDFGVAKSLVESTDASLTRKSIGPMTPQFAAPEQFRGDTLTVATDVYQFGVLMFHVLTGRLPLRADPGDPVAWARAVAEEEPLSLTRALSLTTQQTVGGDQTSRWRTERISGTRYALAGDLEAIAGKALAKEPDQRYASMEALNADLSAYMEGRPVQARRAGALYRVRRFVGRNRAASIVAALAVAAITIGGWLAIDRLRVERDRATAASETSRATADFLVGLFAVADPGENRGERLTANQILERGEQQLQSHASDSPSINAAVAIEIGRVYISLGELERAKTTLATAIDRGKALPSSSPLLARLLLLHGWAEYLSAVYPAAEHDYDRASSLVPLIGDARERDAEAGALAQRQASLARRTGKLQEASNLVLQAIELTSRANGPAHVSLGPIWNELGLIERNRGDHTASIAAYKHALDIYRVQLGEVNIRTLGTEANLAEILMFDDRDAEAEKLLVDGTAQARKLQGGPTSFLAGNLDLLSQIRLDQNRNEDAAQLAEESDQIYVALYGRKHNYRAFPLVHLGKARLALKDGPAALAAFNEALELRRNAFGNEHADTANALRNLGKAELQLGNPEHAVNHLREAVTTYEHVLPAGHIDIPRARFLLIDALIALNRHAEGVAEFAKAELEMNVSRDVSTDDRETVTRLAAVFGAHEKR